MSDKLTEGELKYFESGGTDESGLEPEAGEDIQGAEAEAGESVDGERSDGTVSEGDGAEEETRPIAAESEDVGADESDNETESKRDFKKAYDSERLKRSEIKKQLRAEQEAREHIQKQLDALVQSMGQHDSSKTNNEQAPNKEEDPFGYYQHQLEELNKVVKNQQEYLRQQHQYEEEVKEFNQLKSKYENSALEFIEQQPDFMDAYKFLEKSRINEYMALGKSRQQAAAMLQQDELYIAAEAFAEEESPAERIYNFAIARGYNPDSNKTAKPAKSLDNVEKGLKKAKSLGTSGASNINSALDRGAIDDMNSAEFDNYFQRIKAEQKKIDSGRVW